MPGETPCQEVVREMEASLEPQQFDAEGEPIIEPDPDPEAGLPPYEAGYEGIPPLPRGPGMGARLLEGVRGAAEPYLEFIKGKADLPGKLAGLIGRGAEKAGETIGEIQLRRALAQEPGGMPPVDPSEAPLGLTPERRGRGGEPRMPGRLEDIAGLPGKLAGLIKGGAEGLSSEAIDLMAKYPGLVSAEDREAYLRGDEEFDPDSPDPSRQADYAEPDPNLDTSAQFAEEELAGTDRRLLARMQDRPPLDPEAGYDPAEMAILQRSDVHGDMDAPLTGPPSAEQRYLRAKEKQRLASRGAYADAIRHGRRMAKEQARNAPRFWFRRTGDPRVDAAMGVAMARQFGGVLQEQIKGRTAREQRLSQQDMYDKALRFKSQDQLRQIASDPMTPYGMRQAARMQFASNAGLDVPATGAGGGDRIPAGQAAAQIEAQNPGMMNQIAGAFQAPDGGELNEDIGGYGSLGDLMENVSGWFGGTVRRTNSDQLSYIAQNLAGLIDSGQITPENIAMVGPVIGAKLHAALRRELGNPGGRLSRGGVAWADIQQFMNDIIAGRMPSNYKGLVSPSRTGGLFGNTSQ